MSDSPSEASALAQLCSATLDAFSAEIWARRAWLSRSDELQHPGSVFSPEAVDQLLSTRGLRTPFLRMAKDGKVIPSTRFTGSGGTGATIPDQLRDEDVLRLFCDGATIVLQGVHRTWEPVGRLAAQLSGELGHPVQVNAYITPAQSQGFSPHYDTHDVFVLQVSGEKDWRVHAPVVELPTQRWETVADDVAARACEAPLIDTTLRAGDCLYLPRGFIHSAVARGGTSIHLTFGVHALTQADIVTAVTRELAETDWRASLPVGWDPLTDSDAIADVIAMLARRLTDVEPAAVGARLFDARATTQRPEPLSPISQAEMAANVRPDDLVRPRAHMATRLVDGGILLPGGRVVAVPAEDLAGVEQVLTGHAVRVQDIACAPGTIASLLREGVLVSEQL